MRSYDETKKLINSKTKIIADPYINDWGNHADKKVVDIASEKISQFWLMALKELRI